MDINNKNFFKLENEIYNIDKIEIILDTDKENNLSSLNYSNIILASYDQREEYSKINENNHGIIFDYPFTLLEAFKNNKLNFNLKILNNSLNTCFYLNKTNFTLDLKEEDFINLDEKVKKAIVQNTEIDSEISDIFNRIKINTVIPVAPVKFDCLFSLDFLIPNFLEKDRKYKSIISFPGKTDISIENLNISSDYYLKCEISTLIKNEENKTKIELTIGNNILADINKQLKPSRTPYITPQCVNLTFESEYEMLNFINNGPLLCKNFMKNNDNIIGKISFEVICKITQIQKPSAILCVAPTQYYIYRKNILENGIYFNEIFDKFIEKIKNKDFKIINFKLVNIEREYDDININPSLISSSLYNIKSDFIKQTFEFELCSYHSQPIECIYGDLMVSIDELSELLFNNEIILYPRKIEKISLIKFHPLIKISNKLFLFLKCKNLPKFSYNNNNYLKMNKYTYLRDEEDLSQYTQIIKETTINCYLKQNKLNPRCLKKDLISIFDQLNTDIPPNLITFNNDAKQFSSMSKEAKIKILSNLNSDFVNFIIKSNPDTFNLFEISYKFLIYLTNTDCSKYSSGSTNKEEETLKNEDYIKCREIKKTYVQTIFNSVKTMKCSSFINLIISSNKISDDIEFNLKYVLITINELSNNPESFKEGESENLINLIICLQENFEKYWPNVENYLKNQKKYLKETIQAVKKDTIKIILQTLSNVADIIHYDELDGYISDKKANKTLSGLIIFNKSEEIQKKILDFSKKLNEFGEGNYNLGGIFASIRINDELDMNSDNEVKANYINDKDIVILTNPNFLIRNYNGYILKILVFESPLVSIKSNDGIEGSLDALNTLVSISLYDKNEKEIPVTNITENFRPNILYLKSKYNNINLCLYYNEERKELVNDDILFFNESYLFNGKVLQRI